MKIGKGGQGARIGMSILLLALTGGVVTRAEEDLFEGLNGLNLLFDEQVQTLVSLQEQLAESQRLVAKRDRQIAELKQAMEEMTSEFGEHVAGLGARKDDGGEVAETMGALQREMKAIMEARDGLEGELEGLRQEKERLQRGKVALQEQLSEKESALALAQERAVTEREEELALLHKEAAEREQQLKAEAAEREAALEKALSDLRAETAADRDAARRLREEVSRLRSDLQAAHLANERERFVLAYNAGSLYMTARRYDRAEAEFRKALAIREADAPLHYNMGILYDEHLRQPERARHHYERFLELAPNDRDAPTVMQWLRELP